jgi:hypothetical protein
VLRMNPPTAIRDDAMTRRRDAHFSSEIFVVSSQRRFVVTAAGSGDARVK